MSISGRYIYTLLVFIAIHSPLADELKKPDFKVVLPKLLTKQPKT